MYYLRDKFYCPATPELSLIETEDCKMYIQYHVCHKIFQKCLAC